MKKVIICFLSVMLVFLAGSSIVLAQEDVDTYSSCKYCGMKRGMFSHSRMLLTYDDGSKLGTCSIHCVAVDLALNIDRTPKTIQVGDYNTKSLIDAENAAWVIGGSKPGVMTKRAKWAFKKQDDAAAFIKANGGTAATFDEAMKATYEDMYSDTKMIRVKRNKMRAHKKM
jgi:copper chaperone NosL